jgi:ketosteroid isomerase-like protein
MEKIMQASSLCEAFAKCYNARDLDGLLALYEEGAVLRPGSGEQTIAGKDAIRAYFTRGMERPLRLVQANNFCFEQDGIALARADYRVEEDGKVVRSGSSCEVLRRQPDGSWLYFIDHATGASLPRVAGI